MQSEQELEGFPRGVARLACRQTAQPKCAAVSRVSIENAGSGKKF